LVHVESAGPNGTYHYLWSFVHSFTPAIFAFQTDSLAKLKVNWSKIFENSDSSIQFVNGSVINSFAVEVSNLYFLNTTINANKVQDGRVIYTVPLKNLEWKSTKYADENEIRFTFECADKSQVNGTVSL